MELERQDWIRLWRVLNEKLRESEMAFKEEEEQIINAAVSDIGNGKKKRASAGF